MVKKEQKDRRMRVMWGSNGHWSNSGYGVETQYILKRMVREGWVVGESAFYGLDSFPIELDGIKVYPKMADVFGSDALFFHSNDFKADISFTMQDVWPLQADFLTKLKCWIPYTPIDKDPVPSPVLDKLRYAYRIITFSKYGQETLEKHGFTSELIVEGTDPDIYKPLGRNEMRKLHGFPEDIFLFGVVGANKENPPRKGFQEMLEAFSLFYKNHPDSALFFHTQQVQPGNFPIVEYARYLGFGHRVFFMDAYRGSYLSGPLEIAKEINMFDACLHPSQTEGFGLVVVEAQSCGIPVIVNRCMSMPELVVENKTGWICETDKPRWTSENSFVFPANVDSLYSKMEEVYKKLHESNTVKEDCRNHILQNYDINVIFKDRWLPFLERLQVELLGKPDQK